MKEKFKSYSFWMSVTAGVILVLNNFGNVFGFVVESESVTKIVDSICGVLILFGVLTLTKGEEDKNKNEINNENIDEQAPKNDYEKVEEVNNNPKESLNDSNNKSADKERED